MLMVVAMLNSSLLPAFGVEYNDIDTDENQEMYDILSAYDIFSGYESGNFNYDNLMTRGELAKVLASVSGYMQYADVVQTDFTDVKGTWVEKYVALTESLKIFGGFNDNTFRPDVNTTYESAVAKLLITMGYSKSEIIDDYLKIAFDVGLLDGVTKTDSGITRGQMCQLVYNALKKDVVKYKNGEFLKTGKVLFDNIGTSDRLVITSEFIAKHQEYDMSQYLGNTCDVYFDVGGKVVLMRSPKYEVESGVVNSVMDSNNMFIEENYGTIVIKKIDMNNVIYNYAQTAVNAYDYIDSEIMMLKDSDGIVKVVLNKAEDSAVLQYEDYYEGLTSMIKNTLDDEYIERVFGKSADRLEDSDLKKCYINIYGAVDSFDEIRENDLIKYYPSRSKDFKYLGIKVIRKSVDGIFNGYKIMDGMEYISIDYKLYKIKNEPSEKIVEGDEVFGIFDEKDQIIELNIINYSSKPTRLGMIVGIKSDIDGLPFISVLDVYGNLISYSLPKSSNHVEYRLDDDNSRIYYTDLNVGDYIYYSRKDENHIKRVDKLNVTVIGKMEISDYANNGYIFTNDTLIVDSDYRVLSKDELKELVSGRAYVDSKGYILMFYVESNEDIKLINILTPEEAKLNSGEDEIKTDTETETYEETEEKQSISESSVSGVIDVSRTTEDKLYLLNSDEYFEIPNSLTVDKCEGKYITLTAENGILTTITAYEADGVDCKVTKLYENQVQIFGFSYIEFDKNIKIYICSTDSKGNYTSFAKGGIDDLEIDKIIDYYDTYGNYDGVIDIIIIHK